ncbi:DUF1272 domain-containing protein [Jannaschia aquimarina]|uniref:Urease-associated protein n=1 Tax=Jannaschia aquimarina TaxID=935700 RepID=A0A0D1EEB1_9RHOB|nr:DUF1272 domain-containing protein [Jannaschia aquimarina]KIT16039.1 hypothetical protein jaqu_23100 [Jannaschia aquimarina]SNT00817.1 hypothetical protein SAMN05421775_104221 [Jannaschia aquimarina]
MLQIRPNCEWCDRDLPPDSADAMICLYECTYCADCVRDVLHNVCATCGGGLVPRPIRPRHAHREAPRLGLANQPASITRVLSRWRREDVDEIVQRLRDLPPEAR